MKTQKSPGVTGLISTGLLSPIATKRKHISKQDKMLKLFAEGKRLHRFQAEGYGDHALHSTISSLQKKYGIYFERVFIQVETRDGMPTNVKLYWLEGLNLTKAKACIKAAASTHLNENDKHNNAATHLHSKGAGR